MRSGVYALGAVRLRQQLDLRRHTHELQVALLKRYIANVVEEMRLEIPLDRVSHVIAVGGDVRFAAAQLTGTEPDGDVREIPRSQFLAFCDEVERMDEDYRDRISYHGPLHCTISVGEAIEVSADRDRAAETDPAMALAAVQIQAMLDEQVAERRAKLFGE